MRASSYEPGNDTAKITEINEDDEEPESQEVHIDDCLD